MKRIAVVDNQKLRELEVKHQILKICPVNRTGTVCITMDEKEKIHIDEITCIGCGLCVRLAPQALQIINLPTAAQKDPIHQYGENGFRIFDLPYVQEGTVTAIMGRNGIGKSTVISVLANNTKANFGNYQKQLETEEYFGILNSRFKGTVLQTYFDKLKKDQIKVAFKPQHILAIPQVFSGTVIELFKKISQNETQIQELAHKLQITPILSRDIKVISGGELQRVALCSCLLKDQANLFIFDEISNYLDIYQRLNSSRLITDITQGKTALLVEHDLIVLDYLADYIHIMFGQPAGYGMLTGVKSAKAGINDYLEGYSKEENVKFRERAITFDKDIIIEAKKVESLTKWSTEEIVAGTFKVTINAGEIKRGEVVGIIGQNALGKTTFIRHLVSKGMGTLYLSYKAQMIEKTDNLVLAELSQYQNFEDSFYQVHVLEPLNIEPLLEKNVQELSGGELQRYAIAKCLLQDADLYLLDEPTAFLDIEDRLKVAKMLKNFIVLKDKSAFIIDHDLVFMDYLSERLLVFMGEPSIQAQTHGPLSMKDGMNLFLKELAITFRRDEQNKRPRVNKLGSVKDQEQKRNNEYYYS